MNAQVIEELETAAGILMAPPNIVSNEQRHTAEIVFLNFRKSKSPYALCRQILEESQVQYVLFEAAEVLKGALIREWAFLQESDRLSLRQYLMQYIMSHVLPSYVQDRLLQVLAIMIKRGSVEDFGSERSALLKDIENLVVGSDPSKQILGCSIILNIMREYASTVKSTDVGLPWEVHFKVKKQFEVTDLRRLFQFSMHVLSEIVRNDPPFSGNIESLLEHLLKIAEGVLTWGFVSPMRLIGVYESVYEADQAPCLRLSAQWSEIILTPQLLPLMFQVYWKVRDHDSLAHHAMTCLVQLATLNGGILNNDDVKIKYLNIYMENFLQLITSVNIKNKESLGVSNIVRKLELFFLHEIPSMPSHMQESYFDEITRLTCCFCEGAALEEANILEDKFYMEAFDNMLEAWTNISQEYSSSFNKLLKNSANQIFLAYLQVHLAPPHGTRKFNEDVDEIEDNEDNDRLKFKDQLQAIGMFGRVVPESALPTIYNLLEIRIDRLRAHLHMMQSQAMTIADSNALNDLFEDLHWIILIAGHVLCMDSEGETAMILSEIMQYSISQCSEGQASLEDSLKMMASVQQIGAAVDGIDKCDHSIRVMSAVLKLCALEKSAAEVKLGHFMSPEVGCTLMWFLKRWCLSYLFPAEDFYNELSPILVGALGKDTEGASFILNFVLAKIQSNICNFLSEPILLQDTVDLFVELVNAKAKAAYVVKTEGLWNLFNIQSKLEPGVLPQNIRRGLYKGFVLVGSALQDQQEANSYFEQILSPVRDRFKNLVGQENFNRIYQDEPIKKIVIDILECLIGIAIGSQMGTVETVFDFLAPILSELSAILKLYNDYQVIVQLILELFGQCARYLLCYLNQLDSKRLYESTLATIRVYAKCNSHRLSNDLLQEESNFQDLVLIMELLSSILTKDCLDFSPLANEEEVTVSAAEVSLFGLNFIMPLMTIDLLKYPSLCSHYYKLIVIINDVYPEKICNLPSDLLHQLLQSVELGLTQFGSDAVQPCLDFLQSTASYIYRQSLKDSSIYHTVMPFLKLLLDLTLSHQINSDMMSTASTCIYAFICCYREQYHLYVQSLIQAQSDPLVAERLAASFTKLTENIRLNCERQPKLIFRDNFDKFVAKVHGFLLVK